MTGRSSRRRNRPNYDPSITDVLFLCTGNICRSPMAEALLRHRLAGLGLDGTVGSAGLLSDGAPPSAGSVEAMRRRGIDLRPHRSRVVEPSLLADADLVVGMARLHLREAIVLDPGCFDRAFTLKELVRRGEALRPRNGEALDAWFGDLRRGRRAVDTLGEDPADDIADPIGRPQRVYEATAAELAELIDRLVALVWSPAVHGVQPR